ncbi:hypothetical protein BOA8489_03636 [Boseongicola aestuarii]|uniref:Uncharacterized protein n=1 Tax=Boseongicola aestuarii TaxID=1470561 RepID=A0A238J557_9RHOB|nr:hypothetical protein BOA8489_03636 [Boseongicola aestuarii]
MSALGSKPSFAAPRTNDHNADKAAIRHGTDSLMIAESDKQTNQMSRTLSQFRPPLVPKL